MPNTKKDIAGHLLFLIREIHDARLAGTADPEEVESWIQRLLYIVDDLDPSIGRGGTTGRHRVYDRIQLAIYEELPESKEQKILTLILHPGTPTGERENAVRALHRLREQAGAR